MIANELHSGVAMQSDKHFLFRCGQAWFSIPAFCVREVSITPEVVHVPGCHPVLEGLCRQQSEFIPVVSLAALLDLDAADCQQENHQLITICGQHVWAIQIAEASTLESLDTLSSPELRSDDTASPVMGTAVRGDQIVRVLNPEKLYQLTSQALEQAWSEVPASFPTPLHPGAQG